MKKLAWLLAILLIAPLAGQEPPAVRFVAVDVFIDTADQPLAAFQFNASLKGGKLVGLEGGGQSAFRKTPFHDPKAMNHEHVILADFSTAPAADLPRGHVRVATLHLAIENGQPLSLETHLITAGTIAGKKIKAKLTWKERL